MRYRRGRGISAQSRKARRKVRQEHAVSSLRTGTARGLGRRLLLGRRGHVRHLSRVRPHLAAGRHVRPRCPRQARALRERELLRIPLQALQRIARAVDLRSDRRSLRDRREPRHAFGRRLGDLHRPADRRPARPALGLAATMDTARRRSFRLPGREPAHRLGRNGTAACAWATTGRSSRSATTSTSSTIRSSGRTT